MLDRYEITHTLRSDKPLHHSDPRSPKRWIVEAWDLKLDLGFPVGTAYVAELSNGWVMLEYVVVLREYRRRGAGTSLIEWCKYAWPGIDGLLEEDACDVASRALARKVAQAERIEKADFE